MVFAGLLKPTKVILKTPRLELLTENMFDRICVDMVVAHMAGTFSDVQVLLQDGRKLYVHRNVLTMSGNDYFDTFFEATDNISEVMTVEEFKDYSPQAVTYLFNTFYTAVVPTNNLDCDQGVHLLILGHKYLSSVAFTAAENVLAAKTPPARLVEVLQLAWKRGAEQLTRSMQEQLRKYWNGQGEQARVVKNQMVELIREGTFTREMLMPGIESKRND